MRTVAFTSSMSVSACVREMLTSFPSAAVLLLLRTGSAGETGDYVNACRH